MSWNSGFLCRTRLHRERSQGQARGAAGEPPAEGDRDRAAIGREPHPATMGKEQILVGRRRGRYPIVASRVSHVEDAGILQKKSRFSGKN